MVMPLGLLSARLKLRGEDNVVRR